MKMKENILIAKFMGEVIGLRNNEASIGGAYFRCTVHDLYHEDWNMLMPVFQKIKALGYNY